MTHRPNASIVFFGILLGMAAAPSAGADTDPRPLLDSGKRAGYFQELKAIESESHRERIRILQDAEACIQRAVAFPEFRQCELAERQARDQLLERLRAKRDIFRGRLRSATP
jgi:hypothetical protein